MKPIVLVFVRHYLPGYRSGGPVRSLANLVENLGDALDFRIVTMDRDVLDTAPYSGIAVDTWNDVGKAKVFYAGAETSSFAALIRLIRRTQHDIMYVNSFFDPDFTLRPLLARYVWLIAKRPVIIAPRGELSAGAVALKRWKKATFIWSARAIGLFRNVTWQASSEHEAGDIRRVQERVPKGVVIAPDLSQTCSQYSFNTHFSLPKGWPLRVLFLSRATPMKNLDFVLRTLTQVQTPVSLSIVGPLENRAYWQRCQDLISQLPQHVSANYLGHAEPSRVPEIMAEHDLFFLPTRGENYGHVIAEALSVGTPVLISDKTPWRDLEKVGVGWDLPLTSEIEFAQRIDECSRMSAEYYTKFRDRVRDYASKRLNDPALVESNRRLFMDLVETERK